MLLRSASQAAVFSKLSGKLKVSQKLSVSPGSDIDLKRHVFIVCVFSSTIYFIKFNREKISISIIEVVRFQYSY